MLIKSSLRSNTFARSSREFIKRIQSNEVSPFSSIIRNLKEQDVSTIIDVGANVGQFGLDIRRHGFKGQIFSFEPVKEPFDRLTRNIKKHQPWNAIQLALGASDYDTKINISGNAGLSSSILQMESLHVENFPDSATISNQNIKVSTIDQQLNILGVRPQDILLKVDVQGYESEVLKGASQSLSKIPFCFLEVSLFPLYKGEIPFLPILNELSNFGHVVIDVFRANMTSKGRLLQVEILTKQLDK